MPGMSGDELSGLISAAVAPAALITATAILLSGYTGKHTALAAQARALAAELRDPGTPARRLPSARRQLLLFRRRANLVWSATVSLTVALLLFLATVLSVVFVTRQAGLGFLGTATLLSGLTGIGLAAWLDLTEIVLGRLTIADEVTDALAVADERANKL